MAMFLVFFHELLRLKPIWVNITWTAADKFSAMTL